MQKEMALLIWAPGTPSLILWSVHALPVSNWSPYTPLPERTLHKGCCGMRHCKMEYFGQDMHKIQQSPLPLPSPVFKPASILLLQASPASSCSSPQSSLSPYFIRRLLIATAVHVLLCLWGISHEQQGCIFHKSLRV